MFVSNLVEEIKKQPKPSVKRTMFNNLFVKCVQPALCDPPHPEPPLPVVYEVPLYL